MRPAWQKCDVWQCASADVLCEARLSAPYRRIEYRPGERMVTVSVGGGRRVRVLLVEGPGRAAEGSLARLRAVMASEIEMVRASDMTEALVRLEALPAIDVILLDPEAPGLTVLEAFGLLHQRTPQVPVVVLPGVASDHLAVAVQAVTRSAGGAAAAARGVAALLPKYLLNREHDVATLREALERQDFEPIARIGHNLRGNGVSFGIPEFSAMGERIEAAAQARRRSDLEEAIALLEARLRRILGR